MGQMAPLPCGLPLVWVRLRETILTENLECSPIGSKVLCSTLFWQLLQSTWFQMYWYYHFSGSHQLDQEGDSVFWATLSLHRCAQASVLERTLQLCFLRIDVSKTQHSDCLAEFKTQFSSAFVGDYNLPSTMQWEM